MKDCPNSVKLYVVGSVNEIEMAIPGRSHAVWDNTRLGIKKGEKKIGK